jgi:flavin reductase (DIM6/NTAB) family NADH-FMN oxidoreductase RutF
VEAPRVAECPVQLEATAQSIHPIGADGRAVAIETKIERVHVHESILADGEPDRIDPDKWRPLIMSFQQFYGLTPERVEDSELAKIPESLYRA